MNLRDQISLSFVKQIVATPKGRAHVLRQLADAEKNGEGDIFERTLAHVDDPALAKSVRRHRADEVRHAEMFEARVAATGIEPGPTPPELRIIDRLDRALGGFLDKKIVDRRGVMEAYVVLQVIEERALQQFPLLEMAFRPVDAASADVLAAVARDELRHLRYCHAIAGRYAPSVESHQAFLDRVRVQEARAFKANGAANLAYVTTHVIEPSARRTAMRAAAAIVTRLPGLPLTRFADQRADAPVATSLETHPLAEGA